MTRKGDLATEDVLIIFRCTALLIRCCCCDAAVLSAAAAMFTSARQRIFLTFRSMSDALVSFREKVWVENRSQFDRFSKVKTVSVFCSRKCESFNQPSIRLFSLPFPFHSSGLALPNLPVWSASPCGHAACFPPYLRALILK